MKKLITMAVFSLTFVSAAVLQAQTAGIRTTAPEMIGNIPVLKSILNEIEHFENKIVGKKEDYSHVNADRKALKTKYANELVSQIGLNEKNKEMLDALQAELIRTRKEIENLK